MTLSLTDIFIIASALQGVILGLAIRFSPSLRSPTNSYLAYFMLLLSGMTLLGWQEWELFWPDYLWIALIAGIFFLGQFLEGNILQPKLVGDSVGLHPVWLMFSLSAFGVLMGFTGLLIAVPVAAAIGVLVRFALRKYLNSPLYIGHRPDAAENPHVPPSDPA